MRIAFISREYPPDQTTGGIGTHVSNMAEGLAELGHEVEVFGLANEPRTDVQCGVLVHRVIVPWVKALSQMALVDCDYTAGSFAFASAFWKCLVQRHVEAPFDVLDSGELFADALANAFSRFLPHLVRLYTPQFLLSEHRFHGMKPTADLKLTSALEEFQACRAQMVTSPSRALAETVAARWSIPIDDIPIICNPVNTAMFSPARERIDRPPTLQFTGRLDLRKGFDVFMNALPKIIVAVPDLRVRIVGALNPHDHSFNNEFKRLKEKVGVLVKEDRITFVEGVERRDMPEQYRMADVMAVPSRYDNSPNTLIEAISCAVSVVGAATGGIPEYLDQGKVGVLVPPEDPSALANECIELLKNPARRYELGVAARRWIMQNCDRRVVASSTAKLYEEVLRRFRSGFTLDESAVLVNPTLEMVKDVMSPVTSSRKKLTLRGTLKGIKRRLQEVIQ